MLTSWLRAFAGEGARRKSRTRRRPTCESLEWRGLLATAGTDYILSGYQWANPGHITYSIAPDGVFWDHGVNNLNATFNAKFGNGVWQREIARALATWESVANIEISLTGDSNVDLGAPGLDQGDPRFGDIRFGGYAFQNNTTTLAQSYFPPPDNGTGSGDTEINTAMPWNIGSDYDLYSVMLHETGLDLGLGEPPNRAEVMNTVYGGVRSGLAPGDIAGIQAIYGPRVADGYQSQGQGTGLGNAVDVSSLLDGSGQATVSNVSLATIGDTEYFSVVAPAGSGETLQVTAAASNVSMLSPKVTLFDASGAPIASQGDASQWSNNVSVSDAKVAPGQRFYIAVTGATNDVFAVGGYQLQLNFTGVTPTGNPNSPPPPASPPPPPPPPVASNPAPTPAPTTTPSSTTTSAPTTGPTIAPDRFEPNNSIAQATALGSIATTTTWGDLSLDTASDLDYFSFQNTWAGIYQVSAPGTTIRIFDSHGHQVAEGTGQVAIRIFRPRTAFDIEISASNDAPVANYSLTITSPRSLPTPARFGMNHGRLIHRQVAPRIHHH